MFTLTSENNFHLYSQPADMRKSFDGLSGLIRNDLLRDPLSGDVFIFINKTRNKIKLLHFSGNGFTLYYKRLEEGTFQMPVYDIKRGSLVLTYAQLVMLVDGLSIKNLHQRKRYASTQGTVLSS